MAFKANCDDKRESLSYKLRKVLRSRVVYVLCSDLHIRDSKVLFREGSLSIVPISSSSGAPHREYPHDAVPRGEGRRRYLEHVGSRLHPVKKVL